MVRIVRLAWLFFITVLKRRLAYRGDLIIQSLDEVLRGLVALAMVGVYMSQTRTIADWNAAELITILGFGMIPLAMFHCFCGNLYGLNSRYIIQGEFDRVLLRPYPTFLQICFDRIAIEDLSGAILGLSLVLIAGSSAGMRLDALGILLLAVMILSAFAIIVAVFMAFAATGFFIEDRVGMMPPVYNLMEFGKWPVTIYPNAIKLLITVAIPFGFTAFYPASLFLPTGQADPNLVMIAWCTPLVAVIAMTLAILLWRLGVRHYESVGN